MYFYYFPKGPFKRNAISVYEVPNRFNVDEEEYLELVDNLCNTIKILYKEFKKTYDKNWSNIVIAIKNSQFLIEYNYENLLNSKFTSKDRHLIFKHKYLNIPLQSFNKKEQKVIEQYLSEEEYSQKFDRYFEYINQETTRNFIEYEQVNNFENNIYSNQLIENKKKRFNLLNLIISILKKGNVKSKKKIKEPLYEPVLEPKIQILNK